MIESMVRLKKARQRRAFSICGRGASHLAGKMERVAEKKEFLRSPHFYDRYATRGA
jgi:hypothetical protein